jgi:hypothetical protein
LLFLLLVIWYEEVDLGLLCLDAVVLRDHSTLRQEKATTLTDLDVAPTSWPVDHQSLSKVSLHIVAFLVIIIWRELGVLELKFSFVELQI